MRKTLWKNSGLRWLWLALLVFIVDFVSKLLILNHFELYDSVQIFPFFHLTYVRNFGAAFSAFWGWGGLLIVVAIVVIVALLVMLRRSALDDKWNNIALTLVLGGAIGNLYDRLYHGFVIDFLDVTLYKWRYPTFNIADSAICIGAVILVALAFFRPSNKMRS